MEIEIAYEETRKKELDARYAQFIKTLDFMVATRLCNITVELDKPEKPTAPGMQQECERCKERDSLEQ